MFELAENEKIGIYLKKLIDKKRYSSVRQFGKMCLEERNVPVNDEELRKMANRLSQILKGKKGVQLEDLPVFAKLLEVSCEEILSAGRCFSSSANRVTNYSIALSKDETEWESYIEREDQLILNGDEYGKTVIDYALEFKNYELLKYLMKKDYIRFVGTDEKELFNYTFGAGTSIVRHPLRMNNLNVLDYELKTRHDLRIKMITLAICNRDMKMLSELRAREIPTLYQACFYSCTPIECEKYYDEDLVIALSEAADEILEYFSQEFEITNRFDIKHRFVFPFLNELIEILIEKNNNYVQWILKDALKHNRYALERLKELLNMTVTYHKELYSERPFWETMKKRIIKETMRDIIRYDEGKLICYRTPDAKEGIITNLIRVDVSTDDIQVKRLIQEVNETYDAIQNISIDF